jgi:chaperonin GroEL
MPPTSKDFQQPGVVFQPKTSNGLQRGINTILNAVRPTLGPFPRYVAIESLMNRTYLPERLDSGGTIARRIIQLENRDSDVGAMYIRNVLYSLQEKVGDGTATAGVLFQSIFNHGLHYIVSGGSAMRLRYFMDRLLPALCAELDKMSIQLEGKEQLSGLANTITNDADMSRFLGEIFDIIGAFGRLEIRTGRSREIEREYVEGIYWDTGLVSREMITDKLSQRTSLEETFVLVCDMQIDEPVDLIPLLELCVEREIKQLLLVCSGMSDKALGLLLLKPNLEKVQITVVKAPGMSQPVKEGALQDMAILTGGRYITLSASETLNSVRYEDLGKARRAWAQMDNFGFVGGKGDPRKIRQHIASLRQGYNHLKEADDRKRAMERIGKLLGGSATLWIGDLTPTAVEQRRALAERAMEAMRGAMREGVVAGGGAALFALRPILQKALRDVTDPDEQAAYRILASALEQPMRVLISNAGKDLDEIMPLIKQAAPGIGYDVVQDRVVDMLQSGIFDATAVVKAGLIAAVSGATLALTTDVIVHRKNPPETYATTA